MAVTIEVADVKAGFSTTAPDVEIEMVIGIVDQADACLDANDVPEPTQKGLKLYAARHFLTLQANDGRGNIKSERAPSGAGRSFGEWTRGGERDTSPYIALVRQLDQWGCVLALLDNKSQMGMWAVGGACKGRS